MPRKANSYKKNATTPVAVNNDAQAFIDQYRQLLNFIKEFDEHYRTLPLHLTLVNADFNTFLVITLLAFFDFNTLALSFLNLATFLMMGMLVGLSLKLYLSANLYTTLKYYQQADDDFKKTIKHNFGDSFTLELESLRRANILNYDPKFKKGIDLFLSMASIPFYLNGEVSSHLKNDELKATFSNLAYLKITPLTKRKTNTNDKNGLFNLVYGRLILCLFTREEHS